MTEYPAPPQYPVHIPPHQQYIPASMQTVPTAKPRRRRTRAPASTTKLHRPLTRFYCNDCKKKFRSRILANRNNNAVQHYCALYQKIITRKVDSHSNKCRGDHGMGPCVVKRVDEDPDSDGEDETKAAYYADKGKGRAPNKTPSTANKRKLRDRDSGDPSISYKRQRTNENDDLLALPPTVEIAPTLQYAQPPTVYDYPPPPAQPAYHGMYHRNGYMTQPAHAFHHDAPPYLEEDLPTALHTHSHEVPPPHNGYDEHDNDLAMPPPPIMDTQSEHQQSVSPGIPMPIAIGDDTAPRIENGLLHIAQHHDDNAPPPPPPLELFDPDKKVAANEAPRGVAENSSDCLVRVNPSVQTGNTENVNGVSGDNDVKEQEVVTQNGQKQSNEDDGDCINVSGDDEEKERQEEEEEEEDDLNLKIAGVSPSPRAKHKKQNSEDARKENENEDVDLTLTPQ